MMHKSAKINVPWLRKLHLFEALNETQFEQVIASTEVVSLTENQSLFEHGQQANRFFLLTDGAIKIYRLSERGNEKIIEIVTVGKLIAEAVMFMPHSRYPASAAAIRSAQVYAFDNNVFMAMLRASNTLCLNLLARLSVRLHAQLREIDNLSLQNASFRVVDYLLDLIPDHLADSAVIDLNAPKQAIAARLSITPETFSRILAALAQQNIITIQRRVITIRSIRKLREFARYEHILY